MLYLVGGIPSKEALVSKRRIASHIRFNLNQEYSKMCGFVKARMLTEIVISNSLIL